MFFYQKNQPIIEMPALSFTASGNNFELAAVSIAFSNQ
jgi:hypothetical protein